MAKGLFMLALTDVSGHHEDALNSPKSLSPFSCESLCPYNLHLGGRAALRFIFQDGQ